MPVDGRRVGQARHLVDHDPQPRRVVAAYSGESPAALEGALLKGIALRYVMRRPGVEVWHDRQQEILRELVAVLARRAPDALDPVFAPLWRAAGDDAARLRVVIDQVASLTDPAAVDWHRRLGA